MLELEGREGILQLRMGRFSHPRRSFPEDSNACYRWMRAGKMTEFIGWLQFEELKQEFSILFVGLLELQLGAWGAFPFHPVLEVTNAAKAILLRCLELVSSDDVLSMLAQLGNRGFGHHVSMPIVEAPC